MSDTKSIYQKTILRLWVNSHFGKGQGEKRINVALFTGSLELPDLGKKMFIDMAQLDNYRKVVQPENFEFAAGLIDAVFTQLNWNREHLPDIYLGQLFFIKPRTFVEGMVIFNDRTGDTMVMAGDRTANIDIGEKFITSVCVGDKNGKKSPDYFGANFDVEGRSVEPMKTHSKSVEEWLAKLTQEAVA